MDWEAKDQREPNANAKADVTLVGGMGIQLSFALGGEGCDNPPMKLPYYRLNQSTPDIKW
jgi:hypothetical protein